jgi:hypothetical protein
MKKTTLLLFLSLLSLYSYGQSTCSTALSVNAGLTVVDGINGTQVPTPLCSTANGAVTNNAKGKWYAYTPTVNRIITVTTDIPENTPRVDTRFHVYRGTCDNLICHSGDDDSGIGTNNYSSVATFEVIANTTYYIAFDNRWTSNGFTFKLVEHGENPCITATAITAGNTITVNSIDGENLPIGGCSQTTSAAKWYSYTPTANYNLTISSDLPQNICKNTNFSVYTGNCPGVLTCITSDDDSGVIQCNSGNSNSLLSRKTFEVNAGTTYYIAWDNKWSNEGFDFILTEQIIVIPVTYSTQNISGLNSPLTSCVVDMNNDNLDDIVGVSNGNLNIHYQTNSSTFNNVNIPISGTSKMPSWSIAAGDYNKDGYNDLVLGDGNGLSLWKSENNGTAYTSITPGQYIFCQRTNFVDLNNDGNLDVFSCHDIDPNVYYLNDGAGNLTYYQSGITPGAYNLGIIESGGNYASIWTDYDNDGDVDLFISKCSGPPSELHRNDGNGVFTDISAIAQINVTPVQSWSSAVADFDNDGDMDIVIGSNGGVGHMFFRNDLDKSNDVEEPFANITAGSGLDLDNTNSRDYLAYDFDNDGWVDIMGGGSKIMFNKGNNVFEPTYYTSIGVGAVGDLNNDGFLDIVSGSTIKYAIPNGNKWLKIATKGIQSNSNGIGARIEIYGSWGKQIRDVRSGEGFEYMSTLNTHFGIGQATIIDQVVIKWPSGIVDTFTDVTPNQMLVVTEGQTLGTNSFDSFVFTVYPNPVKNTINININTSNPVEFNAAFIYDLNGRLVQNSVVENKTLNVDTLAKGTYILKLKDDQGKEYTQKFIKE